MAQVTVGLPVYNGESFIDEAMASLCAQDYADLKIFVSDNASTDKTNEILQRWAEKDPRVIIHRQKENIGAIANFKWLAQNADTPWFCYAAYDDLWSPNFFSALYQATQQQENVVLAVPRMVLTKGNSREHDRTCPAPSYISHLSQFQRRFKSIAEVNSGWFYGLGRRDILLDSMRATDKFPSAWGSDFLTPLYFILAGDIAVSDAAIYYKQVTPLSEERYRPKTAYEQFKLQRAFWRVQWQMLKAARLPLWQKAALLLPLLQYNRHAGRLKRTFKLMLRGKLK